MNSMAWMNGWMNRWIFIFFIRLHEECKELMKEKKRKTYIKYEWMALDELIVGLTNDGWMVLDELMEGWNDGWMYGEWWTKFGWMDGGINKWWLNEWMNQWWMKGAGWMDGGINKWWLNGWMNWWWRRKRVGPEFFHLDTASLQRKLTSHKMY